MADVRVAHGGSGEDRAQLHHRLRVQPVQREAGRKKNRLDLNVAFFKDQAGFVFFKHKVQSLPEKSTSIET